MERSQRSQSIFLAFLPRAFARTYCRVLIWVHGNLQRWLVLPIMVVTTIAAIVACAIGLYLIEETLLGVENRRLDQSSAAVSTALTVQGKVLAEAAAGPDQSQTLLAALEADDQSAAGVVVEQLAQTYETYGWNTEVIDVPGESGAAGGSVYATVDRGTGRASELLGDPAVRRSLEIAATAGSQAGVDISFANLHDGPVLYAARPLVAGNQLQGLLLIDASLQQLFGPMAVSRPTALAIYNADRTFVYSTQPEVRGPLPDVPAGAEPPGSQADLPKMYRASLPSGPYGYQVRPLHIDARQMGYLVAWQPLGSTLARVRLLQGAWFAILLLGVLGMLVLSNRLAGYVVRPVVSLAESARLLAEGSSAAYSPQQTIGELVHLAEAFNNLSAQVHRQTGVLLEQARQSNYLFEASAELGRTLDLDESVQTAAEAIYGLTGLSYVLVFVGHGELGPYTCRAVRGLPGDVIRQMVGQEYSVPLWGVMARALVGRQPLVIDDIIAQNRPRPGEFDWDVGRGSMLLFPVSGANGAAGLIIAGAPDPGAFSIGTLGDLVFALARIASQSVQNAQLYQEAIRSQEQLVTLQVISRLVASTTQIDNVLDIVVREAGEIMGDSQAWLFLKDSGGRASRLYSQTRGGDAESWTAVHQDAVTWVTRAGQPIFYDPGQPLAQAPILVHGGSAMCVPLEVDDDTLGALVVVSRKHRRTFAEDDMIVLRTLTNAAALAVRTAQLAERFQSDYLDLAQAWALHTDLKVWGRPGHAARVAANAKILAVETDLPSALHPILEVAAYLHDIALETVADEAGPDCLCTGNAHAEAGADRLAGAGLDGRIVTLVRHHHMARPDLSIADADLSKAAAILALVNLVDGWLAGRPDHEPSDAAQVRERLLGDVGLNFPAAIVTEYVRLWTAGRLVMP